MPLDDIIDIGLPIQLTAYSALRKALVARGMSAEDADAELVAMIAEASAADAQLDQVQEARRKRLQARLASQ